MMVGPHEPLTFFNNVQVLHIKLNSITVASVLPAYGDLLNSQQDQQIHCYVTRILFESSVSMHTKTCRMECN